MRSIYLIGANHTYQFGSRPNCDVSENALAEYRDMVLASITRHKIVGIAEEMTVQALRKHFVQGNSVAFNLAKERGLVHRYCCADISTREARGIKTNEQKERYWIEQLETFDAFPAIFLLGSDHIGGFTSLLKESGFQPVVLAADWEPSLSNDRKFSRRDLPAG